MKLKKKIKKFLGRIIKTSYNLWYKFVTVDEKTILFISFHGRGYSCNPKYLHKYLLSNEKYKDYKFVWAVKKGKGKEISGAKVIRYNSVKYFYYLAKSKYWIVNCKLPRHILKKENQVYLQTWHGTPLKRLAHDIQIGSDAKFYRTGVSKKEMTDTYDIDVKRYNYLISPNKFSTEKFQSAFEIERNRIIETGYPRNDYLTNITDSEINNLKEKYKIPKDKKVILYAPTWRDNSFNVKGYTFKLEVNFNKWKEVLGEEYVVLFKPHYLITNKFNNDGLEEFLYTIKEDKDINELYVISDILVTDYSSVFFDYAILQRPILFYMYDLKEYDEEIRGFYLDINKDLPGSIFTKEDDLLKKILNIEDYKKSTSKLLNDFNNTYNYLQDGHASERVIKILLE
ncbi:CDP-glycerol glycerophosphotransferase family protein [Clostridium bornimense]|uniref:CDP-glycerol glycerophosphotransferase family protein n=1 Tax=Clostridium bornimense TaxID=1216932 RepID=UPI001C117CB4|nr:CDP-glycerol glycerophosphotransferase family protein [Clostridium bornimense]MBU5315163.1 CDP-glycerol glycerophosphotransferase family protein [Clostridium bornimense]